MNLFTEKDIRDLDVELKVGLLATITLVMAPLFI